ncbi:MAG: hypothetical protein KTR27_09560 [Leptolyngbyaceae cyanobacterium MAG.088]|nr:hypothetical protein [Leptolyngbyaceae cyanobacterium MAG.088]
MPGSFIDISNLTGSHQPPVDQWTVLGGPEEFAAMPLTHQDQIIFLDGPSTQTVYEAFNRRDLLCGDDGWGNRPFRGGCYKTVAQHRGDADLKKWLYQRGLPFADNAFLLPAFAAKDAPAILTSWKIVVKYAPEIFSGDNIVVVGETVNWCLHYHHDGVITFACEPDWTKMGR